LSSTTLANAMFKAGFENSSRVILENRDIKIFSAS
jgi:hypothetical protein